MTDRIREKKDGLSVRNPEIQEQIWEFLVEYEGSEDRVSVPVVIDGITYYVDCSRVGSVEIVL